MVEQQRINPRSVPAGRGAGWILEGFNYFKAGPLGWIAFVIVLFIISFFNPLISFFSSLVSIVGGLLYEVLASILLGGLMLGCRAVDTAGRFQFRHVFSGFGSDKVGQLALVGVIDIIASVLIFSLVALMIFIQFGGEVLALIWDSQSAEQQAEGIDALSGAPFIGKGGLLLLDLLVGMALFLPIMMATWMAPALIVLEKVNAVPAMILSFRACLVNIIPLLVCGVVALILLIIPALPFIVVGLFGFLSIIFGIHIIIVAESVTVLFCFLCVFVLTFTLIASAAYIAYKDTLSS